MKDFRFFFLKNTGALDKKWLIRHIFTYFIYPVPYNSSGPSALDRKIFPLWKLTRLKSADKFIFWGNRWYLIKQFPFTPECFSPLLVDIKRLFHAYAKDIKSHSIHTLLIWYESYDMKSYRRIIRTSTHKKSVRIYGSFPPFSHLLFSSWYSFPW